ncbi:MAG TPA: gliding motility lipoprotein GldH [Bacteroidia bacterium]|jgi:gliding motility-associated lipoprotein GldH|nr:gliding motility lipoprotein GldH [Bacteroidia bacterium]
MANRKSLLRYLIAGVVIIVFASCNQQYHFEENKSIKGSNWDFSEPISFDVNIDDTLTAYNMYINVRNQGNYRFSNLFLFINTHLPQGQHLRDTVEITLATPDGAWLGKGIGDLYSNRYLFRKNFRFPQKGDYHFELIQAMRVNPLPGILDAGIRIEKTKQ